MTTNYKVFLNEVESLSASVMNLKDAYMMLPKNSADGGFELIFQGIDTLREWAKQMIDNPVENNAEFALMEEFLGKIKALFEEYSASIHIRSGEGYGENWGGGSVMEVSIEKDGVKAKSATPLVDDNNLITDLDFDIAVYEMID